MQQLMPDGTMEVLPPPPPPYPLYLPYCLPTLLLDASLPTFISSFFLPSFLPSSIPPSFFPTYRRTLGSFPLHRRHKYPRLPHSDLGRASGRLYSLQVCGRSNFPRNFSLLLDLLPPTHDPLLPLEGSTPDPLLLLPLRRTHPRRRNSSLVILLLSFPSFQQSYFPSFLPIPPFFTTSFFLLASLPFPFLPSLFSPSFLPSFLPSFFLFVFLRSPSFITSFVRSFVLSFIFLDSFLKST